MRKLADYISMLQGLWPILAMEREEGLYPDNQNCDVKIVRKAFDLGYPYRVATNQKIWRAWNFILRTHMENIFTTKLSPNVLFFLGEGWGELAAYVQSFLLVYR
jgi:hypothetical protein